MSAERCLLLQVHLTQGRYHGAGHWPPSPARVFQALVASAGPQQDLPVDVREALQWLECLHPPAVNAPTAHAGQKVTQFVPNNDLDAEGGDPKGVESIRVAKVVRPFLFDGRIPISYAWTFAADPVAEAHAQRICALALGLYQLGRGADAAWATAQVQPLNEGLEALRHGAGEAWRPSMVAGPGALHEGGNLLECPIPGSLDSLTARYVASAQRFGIDRTQRKPQETFSQPPRPSFLAVPYGSARVKVLYELRSPDSSGAFVHFRLAAASEVVQRIRDAAMERLMKALPDQAQDIQNTLLGRPVNGRPIPAEQRVRILALPSIGHAHVDRGIRRVLVDIPAQCPIALEDLCWAFSGLSLATADTGEVVAMLVAAENVDMLGHYGIGEKPSRKWRTVTPVVLGERYGLDGPVPEKLGTAASDLLRHAGISARALQVRAQRAPFERHGVAAEQFAANTRFSGRELWHVEMTLDQAIHGALMLGDGRYVGLGLLAPIADVDGLLCYRVTAGLSENARPEGIARALRRAVMARCGGGNKGLASYVHGHDGERALRDQPHLYFQFDPENARLWVMAPHIVERRAAWGWERQRWNEVCTAMNGFSQLLAGEAGAVDMQQETLDLAMDPFLAPALRWETVTEYVVNRHRDAGSAHAALIEDVRHSLADAGLPPGEVEVGRCHVRGQALCGQVRLTFSVAITGPLVLGRHRFLGGGLFRAVPGE